MSERENNQFQIKIKCKQKLCQRTEHPIVVGNCNVSDDVLKQDQNDHQLVGQMKSVKWVEFDLNEMINTHKKLSKGEVEPPIINSAEIDMKSQKFSNQVENQTKLLVKKKPMS